MIKAVKNSELEYIKCYSKYKENDKYIKFWDDNFENLYSSNILVLKRRINFEDLNKLIKEEINLHKKLKKKFLVLELDYNCSNNEISKLEIKPTTIDRFNYLFIETNNYKNIEGNEEGNICVAKCRNDYKQAIKFNLMDNANIWGRDFTYYRIKRKILAYKQNKNLFLYLCNVGERVIGSCELLLNKDVAKIEDFGITKKFQRKGYGKALIKKVLKECYEKNVYGAYVVTQSNGIANEIYRKIGFRKVGEKIQLIYEL